MGMIKVPLQAVRKFNEELPNIFSTGNLAESKWNESLAEFYKQYSNAKYAVPFCSNGAGLLSILMLLRNYRRKKDIFIQSNTMYGVKTIAITSGLNYLDPVRCSLRTLMPTAASVREYIKLLQRPSDTVFLLTHIGGIVNPEIREIVAECNAAGVVVIEDCAHSLGATLFDMHTGLFGLAGVYSLYATKAIAAGEGGIAVTNDPDLNDALRRFNIYDRFDRKQEIGTNFRVSEVQALFSLCVSECSEHIISNKMEIAKEYANVCVQRGIRFVDPFSGGQRGNHYKFTVIASEDGAYDLSRLTQRTSPVYDYALGDDPEGISTRHVCVPVWYDLEEEIVDRVIGELKAL